MKTIEEDAVRYGSRAMPNFQYYYRKVQITPPLSIMYGEKGDIQVAIQNTFKNEPY